MNLPDTGTDLILEPTPSPQGTPPPTASSHPSADGLRVILERIPGITPKKLLPHPLLFQVPPIDDFRHKHGRNHTDYETVVSGGFSRKGSRQPITIAFPTMSLDWKPMWSLIHDPNWKPNPLKITEQLIQLAEHGDPFYFTSGQPKLWGRYDILELPMTLRDIEIVEKPGELDTRYVDVAFTEYRSPLLVSTRKKGKARRRHHDRLPTWVQVFENGTARDRNGHHFGSASKPATLHMLALHFYGSYAKWTLIAKRNGMRDFAATRSLAIWAKRHKGADKLTIPRQAS